MHGINSTSRVLYLIIVRLSFPCISQEMNRYRAKTTYKIRIKDATNFIKMLILTTNNALPLM